VATNGSTNSGSTNSGSSNCGVFWYFELSGACAGRLHSAEFPTQTSLVIEAGGNMTRPFNNWISKAGVSQDCAVITVDVSGNVLYRDQCRGTVSQVDLPACDATSTGSGYIRVTITTPSVNARSSGNGKYNKAAPIPKPLLSRNFKLSIDGLQDCQYVNSVTGLSVGKIAPSLTTQLKELRAADIRSWQQKGNSPKGGSLAYLSADMKTSILTVDLSSMRISNIVPAYPTNPNQQVSVGLQASAASLKC